MQNCRVTYIIRRAKWKSILCSDDVKDKNNEPEISIVVPIVNEIEELFGFLENLAAQKDIHFQLLVVDGGSTDGSVEYLQQQQLIPNLLLVQGPTGRGRQLNQGARAAAGDYLLFLHVDSRFADPLALKKSLALLQRTGSTRVAGHFALSFRRTTGDRQLGYYFYEWKARTGRPETIHGDQGFLLPRQLFDGLGGFREDLPVMEDTDLAERLRQDAQWQLLPAVINTSARRFEVEGLWQRQLLGALLMCFRSIGWNEFFVQAPALYRQQKTTSELRLCPFFKLILDLLNDLPRKERWRVWSACGSYVRGHAWQIFLFLDVWRTFRQGRPVGSGALRQLAFWEPVFDFLTANPIGQFTAALVLRCWFAGCYSWLQRKEGK